MTDPEADGYLLGSRDEELLRLAFQHRVWAAHASALWARAGFRYGATLADLGCGPGFTTLELAQLVGPRGTVIGVDSSARFLEHLRLRASESRLDNVEIVETDVHLLDLASESLDGAYARWLFCFVKDPARVVGRVARALRPGAPFAISDYFNYRAFTFAPKSATLDRIVDAVETCWRRSGGDLEIQGRMPRILRECGLDVRHVAQIAPVARPGSPLWNWPRTFFRSFLPTLERAGLVTADDGRALFREWGERDGDPTSRLYLPPQTEIVAVRPG